MNFRQLEYITEIYREGGVRKAAEKLFITQPALSQQLQKTEEELGIRLFERGTNPLKPTYAGEYYLKVAQRILYEQEQARIWIDEMKQLMHGSLSIGISQARSTQFLPLLLPEFKKRYPEIRISLYEEPMFKFRGLLSSGEIDFGLMASEPFAEGLAFLPMVRERFLLAVPSGSRADKVCKERVANGKNVLLSDMKQEPFILLHHGGYLRKMVEEVFVKNSMKPEIVLESVNTGLCLSMCGAGYGVTIVSELSAMVSNANPSPSYYSLDHEFSPWRLGIVYHPDHYQTGAMGAFIEFTKEKIAEFPFAL